MTNNNHTAGQMGRVVLVGAGCGPADLITLRGMQLLRRADAVVYDALMDPDLLTFARPDAQCICAGKRSGQHSMPQDAINALLIQLARQGKLVCRLKGGDPFVFGRGGEEAEALRAAGIPVEEIPGITSAVAIPAAAGIPVTHRGLSRSVHVITGHTANTPDGLPEQLDLLARLKGTVVFLMALNHLPALSARLLAAGMPPQTPAAVCGVRTVRATLATVAAKAEGFPPPAVVVIGGSAGVDLWAGQGPLEKVSIGLTGTRTFRAGVYRVFSALGANLQTVQRTRLEPVCTSRELACAMQQHPDWIVLTSPNGVQRFFVLMGEAAFDLRRLGNTRFAAVGPGTAASLAERGIYADLIPRQHDTESLGQALAENCKPGSRVLLAGAEQSSPAPRLALERRGILPSRLPLYRTAADNPTPATVDYLVFGSAGGVRQYFSAGGLAPRRAALCIGKVTAAEVARYTRSLTAEDTTPEALAQAALRDWLAGHNP